MAITVVALGSIWNTTAGAKTVTATPAVNDLIVVIAGHSYASATGNPPTASDNGVGGTYSRVVFANDAASADVMSFHVRNALVPSAVSTIYTSTPAGTDTGGGLAVFAIRGWPTTRVGADAYRQGWNGGAGSGTPTVNGFPAAALTGNPCFGAVMTKTNSTTNTAPPTGWTESHDLGYTTPATGLETCWIAGGFTGQIVTWTAAAPSAWFALIMELDSSAAPTVTPGPYPNRSLVGTAVHRASRW